MIPPHHSPASAAHPIFTDIIDGMISAPVRISEANNRSLAGIITSLINENEPLLKAEQDGTTVTVRERGGPAVMVVEVRGENQ